MEKVLLTLICRPKQWKTISSKDLLESGYPVYGANGKIGFYNSYTHEHPTVLITCRGATCGSINISDPKSYVNGNAMALDNLSEEVDLYYLKYYLEYRKLDDVISGSAQPQITGKGLSKVKIPLPPLDQQKKIAAISDAADAYRQKTKALIEKYDELTQSLFLDMFGDPVRNPKDWNEVIFTEVLVLRRGFDLPRQDRIKGEYPIMASNGILDWHNEFKVEGPGIVTGRSGTLGKVHYIEGDYWPLNTALYSQKLNGNNPIYLIYLIRNFRVERFSRGAGVPTLNRNLVHAETIMTVPIELQNQFADRVQAIEAQKAQAKASLAQAEDLFNSLLQRAFKGELTS